MRRTSTEPAVAPIVAAAWQQVYAEGRSIPELDPRVLAGDSQTRAGSDARAAWYRWHDASLDVCFRHDRWCWYAVFERARVETLAGRHLPGIASNLADLDRILPVGKRAATVYRAARRMFAGEAIGTLGWQPAVASDSPSEPTVKRWLGWMRPESVAKSVAPVSEQQVLDVLAAARPWLQDGRRFAEHVSPLVHRLAASYPMVQPDEPDAPDMGSSGESEPPLDVTEDADARILAQADPLPPEADPIDPEYRIYTRRLDKTLHARTLYEPRDGVALARLSGCDRRRARQLAHRLQRELMAARLRRWEFDQDEGLLDSRRLARLVIPGAAATVFRRESDAPVPEACVTFLVDQSGSMRGDRQRMAVQALDLAVHTLEVCHIRCEVLGYTTRYGRENPVRDRWRAMGGPAAPGRLNALLHIVYKTPAQPWRRARPWVGVMLRDGFGRENIDGEALDWAAKRVAAQPERRKILIVLGDGAPHDDATVEANGREFLVQHLRTVIERVEASPIQLAGIGTGRQVGRFYRRALSLQHPEQVAGVLFDHLAELLTAKEMH